MKKWVLAIGVVIVLSGCQPTPKDGIISSKVDGYIEEAISATPAPVYSYSIDEHINSKIHTDNTEIYIDADVVKPDTERYSVLRVEPVDIKEEKAKSIVNNIFGSEPLYEALSTEPVTQEEIMNLLIGRQAKLIEMEKSFEGSSQEYEDFVALYEQETEYWKDKLKTAPTTIERKPMEIKYIKQEDIGDVNKFCISGSLITDSDISTGISFYKSSLGKDSIMYYYNYENLKIHTDIIAEDDKYTNTTISKDDAIKQAREFIEKLGCEDVDIVCTGLSLYDADSNAPYEDRARCYVIIFGKTYNGIQQTYVNNSSFTKMFLNQNEDQSGETSPNINQYNQYWGDEHITVFVDRRGVVQCEWAYPSKIANVINENVNLLPFSEVKEQILNQLKLERVYHIEGLKYDVYIDKIVLGYSKVIEKDSNNEYMLIPTWDAVGRIRYKGPDGELLLESLGQSFLTINAIDGSVIDRNLGY